VAPPYPDTAVPEVALFAYPWDIKSAGAVPFAAEARKLGANRVYVATRYHTAEVIMPRRKTAVVFNADENGYHLPLARSAFSGIGAQAPVDQGGQGGQLFGDLAQATAREDVGLSAWIVALHASRLAQAHPESALENCFGDRSAHFLCPADPATATYLAELVAATLATGMFSGVMLEGVSYGLLGHGHPHELHGVRMDPVCRYLASLCFCRSCLAEGQRRGIDGAQLRAWVTAELGRTWNGPLGPARMDDEGAELASLLVTQPGLAAWTRMRCEIVTGLVDVLSAIGRDLGVRVDLSAAIWGRPVYLNWMEGVDLAASGPLVDHVVLESYYPSAAEIARELDHASFLLPPAKLGLAALLWHGYLTSYEDLASKIDLALSCGISKFSFYHLSSAPSTMLGWLPRISTHIQQECARYAARGDDDAMPPAGPAGTESDAG
jgi:hypothetical protein